MKNTQPYQVKNIKPLSNSVIQLVASPIGTPIKYLAGQYVHVHLANDNRPFSVANAPLGGLDIEFHIRHTADNLFTNRLFKRIQEQGVIYLTGPYGKCTWQSTSKSYIFLSKGTGFAPMKALIEQALTEDGERHMHLFWIANSKSDLYLRELPEHWTNCVSTFKYSLITSTDSEVEDLCKAVLAIYPQLHEQIIYSAGHPEMINAVYLEFLKHGLKKAHMLSDAIQLTS